MTCLWHVIAEVMEVRCWRCHRASPAAMGDDDEDDLQTDPFS
jgi:hypothetical protein